MAHVETAPRGTDMAQKSTGAACRHKPDTYRSEAARLSMMFDAVLLTSHVLEPRKGGQDRRSETSCGRSVTLTIRAEEATFTKVQGQLWGHLGQKVAPWQSACKRSTATR